MGEKASFEPINLGFKGFPLREHREVAGRDNRIKKLVQEPTKNSAQRDLCLGSWPELCVFELHPEVSAESTHTHLTWEICWLLSSTITTLKPHTFSLEFLQRKVENSEF